MKITIAGTGYIAKEVLREVSQLEVLSIYGRTAEKAEALAREYDIPSVHTDYEEMLRETKADFIYIGLSNTAHFEFALKALRMDRNVILEKPFTLKKSEAEILVQEALDRGLYLFEAVTSLYMPTFKELLKDVQRIGKVKLVQSNYSQYSSRYDAYRRGEVLPAFDPRFKGGALNDINIYNINLVAGIFGAPVKSIYFGNRGFNGIDTSGVAILQYKDFVATISGAKDSDSKGFFMVQGEDGYIYADGIPSIVKEYEIILRDGTRETKALNKYDHRLIHEFVEMDRIYLEKDYEEMKKHLKTSLAVVKTLEDLNKSIQMGDEIFL